MEPVNIYDVELTRDDDDPKGYEAGYVRLGPLLGQNASARPSTSWNRATATVRITTSTATRSGCSCSRGS